LPDKRTTLKAFVVLKGPTADAKAATRALQDYVKQKLVPYKYPRLVEFLPELPKTGTDKIDRQALLTGAIKLRRAHLSPRDQEARLRRHVGGQSATEGAPHEKPTRQKSAACGHRTRSADGTVY